jgi:hypothetical protein
MIYKYSSYVLQSPLTFQTIFLEIIKPNRPFFPPRLFTREN